MRRLFGPGFDEPLARQSASGVGAWAWYGTDQLGSVRMVFDNSGTVIGSRSYTGFGEMVSETGAGLDRYANTACEWHAGICLQYSRARMCDPKVGRWTSEDPLGFGAGDTNLSRYVGNGSTLARDPRGYCSREFFGLLGIAAGYLSKKVDEINEGIQPLFHAQIDSLADPLDRFAVTTVLDLVKGGLDTVQAGAKVGTQLWQGQFVEVAKTPAAFVTSSGINSIIIILVTRSTT